MKLTEEQIESMFENHEDIKRLFELHKSKSEEYYFEIETRQALIAFKAATSLLLPIIEKQNKALIEASNALVYHYYNNLDNPLTRIETDIAQVNQMIEELGDV